MKLAAIQSELIHSVDSLCDFLLSRSGTYYFDGVQAVLATEEDADSYNAIMDRIRAAMESEQIFRAAQAEKTKAKLEKLEGKKP